MRVLAIFLSPRVVFRGNSPAGSRFDTSYTVYSQTNKIRIDTKMHKPRGEPMSHARRFLTLVTASVLSGSAANAAEAKDAIFTDYGRALVGKPPAALGLDPFYEKYVDAGGIPVTTSAK